MAAGSAEPTLLGQYGTWGAYAATPNGKKVWLRAREALLIEKQSAKLAA